MRAEQRLLLAAHNFTMIVSSLMLLPPHSHTPYRSKKPFDRPRGLLFTDNQLDRP
jgi:hypothetical protein